jgi:hypothetical protein
MTEGDSDHISDTRLEPRVHKERPNLNSIKKPTIKNPVRNGPGNDTKDGR